MSEYIEKLLGYLFLDQVGGGRYETMWNIAGGCLTLVGRCLGTLENCWGFLSPDQI